MNSDTRMPARLSSSAMIAEAVMAAFHVEPAFGRALLALFGHEAGGVRARVQRDRHHLVGRGHLEIERLR